MANEWILHIKAYATKNGVSYKDALKDPKCKECYKEGSAKSDEIQLPLSVEPAKAPAKAKKAPAKARKGGRAVVMKRQAKPRRPNVPPLEGWAQPAIHSSTLPRQVDDLTVINVNPTVEGGKMACGTGSAVSIPSRIRRIIQNRNVNPFVMTPEQWIASDVDTLANAMRQLSTEELQTMGRRIDNFLEMLRQATQPNQTLDELNIGRNYWDIQDEYLVFAHAELARRQQDEEMKDATTGGKLKTPKEINRAIRKGFRQAVRKPKKLLDFVGSFKKSDNPYETPMSRFTSPLLSKLLSQYDDEGEWSSEPPPGWDWRTMYTPEEVAYLEQRHAAEAANQMAGTGNTMPWIKKRVAPERIPDTIYEEPVAPIQRQRVEPQPQPQTHPDAVMPFADMGDVNVRFTRDDNINLFANEDEDGTITIDDLRLYTTSELEKMKEEYHADAFEFGKMQISSHVTDDVAVLAGAIASGARDMIHMINVVLKERWNERHGQLDFAPNGAGLRAIARKMHGRGRFSMYPKKKEPQNPLMLP